MRPTTLTLALLSAPGLLAAQASSSTRAEGRAHASAEVKAHPHTTVTAGLSAEARATLEAMLAKAETQHLPSEPMTDIVAEGRAKGAAEAQILAAAQKAMARLEASQSVLIRAGREHPSEEEVKRGASLIARGVSEAELEAFVEHAPSDRSLVVAFDVLTELTGKGLPVDQALAVIGARLEAGASDAQLHSLGGTIRTDASALAGLGIGLGKPNAGTESGSSVGTTVSGTVKSPIGLGVTLGRRP
jgi:hypothetical protein